MRGAVFHHVGVACDDLDHEESAFAALGYVRERADVVDRVAGVQARFLVGAGPRIELVRNLAGQNILSELLKRGIKFYHLAYEVDDIEAATEQLGGIGGKRVVEPLPAIGFGMRSICFCVLPNTMLVELISRR